MPNWDGIEDVSAKPCRVWLSRVKETDEWKPLRKVDCWALNDSKESTVYIEGGRCTADKEKEIITQNFHRAPTRELKSAIWFVRKDPEKKIVEPIFNEADTTKIETLYQLAITASSSLGQGIDSVLKEEVELEDNSKVMVVKTVGGSVLSIRRKLPGWLAGSELLQRGYGAYTVEGEEYETMLRPVAHLWFVVHGIGESIWSREDTSMASMIEEVNRIRISMQKRQIDDWRKQCEKAKKAGNPVPPMPHRIECIPIEWYDRVHSSSNALSKTLKSITLPTIPALRGIANEAVFDVLLYITPTFCEPVLDCVTTQISTAYEKFLKVHPKFVSDGGKCHLMGHSLGSVIVWDLLSILKDFKEPVKQQNFGNGIGARETSGGVQITSPDNKVKTGYQAYAEEHAATPENGTWGPTLPKRPKQTLPFVPENVIFLGSPIGMFLTLRGAHPTFDLFRQQLCQKILKDLENNEKLAVTAASKNGRELSNVDNKQIDLKSFELPFASPFTLPVTGGIYNIFHPSDPVAYRIEPLLLPPDIEPSRIPPPVHLTVQGEVRLHIKAQQLGDEIAKALEGKRGSFANLFTQAVAALGKSGEINSPQSKTEPSTGPEVFPLGGTSKRVDYQLQTGVVDNEYLSSVMAHSSYFVNTDVQDFLISLGSTADSGEAITTVVDVPVSI